MSLDVSLYHKEVNIQKSISFIQRYLFGIVKGHPSTVEHELCIIIFNIQIKAIFLWCNYKT